MSLALLTLSAWPISHWNWNRAGGLQTPPADGVAVGLGVWVAVAVGGATVAVRVAVGGTVVGVRVAVGGTVVGVRVAVGAGAAGVFVAVAGTAVQVAAAGAVAVEAIGVLVAGTVAVGLGSAALVAAEAGVGVFVRRRHQPSASDWSASRLVTGRYTGLPPSAVATSELRSVEMGRALVLGAPVRPTPRAKIRQAVIQATAVVPRKCHLRFLVSHDGERRLSQCSAVRGARGASFVP